MTKERLDTNILSASTVEHLHRYSVAQEFSTDKKVLDIACGEGYGTNLISKKAELVIGVDNDTSTIKKAQIKYKNKNSHFIHGDIKALPFENNYFDLIVCFETIEHVHNPNLAILEIERVLKPDGLLLISTPNKLNYSDKTNYKNKFHIKEFYEEEFINLIKASFINVKLFSQQMAHISLIFSSEINNTKYFSGNFKDISNYQPESIYFFIIAGKSNLPQLTNSTFVANNIFEEGLIQKEKLIKKSCSYRIGHFILYPFKFIKKIINL
ncbi:MAG: class I SAM-dependent methyltransferase [Flavobacteriaceae bacterium]|nr:class I SAM-dependent methyltransferase [Flavobacteriaceae bacterium]